MKKKMLFLFVCVMLAGMAWATDYPISATITYSTTDAPSCGDVDSVVYRLIFDGADSAWGMRAPGDTANTCCWQYDTTVTTAGPWGWAAYVWFDGSVVGFAADDFNVLDPSDFMAASGGEGETACSLWIKDAATHALIEGASVTVRLDGLDDRKGRATTESSGLAVFTIDDAVAYDVYVGANNYVAQATPALEFTMSGVKVDTIDMDAFDPGSPDSADMCRVFGWVYDLDGDPIKDVEITINPTVGADTLYRETSVAVIAQVGDHATTDADGYWYLDRRPSTVTTPFSQYTWAMKKKGLIEEISKIITIPDQATANIETLVK